METIINADSTMQTGTQYILHEPKEATMQATNPIFDFTATFNAALAQAINQATHHLHKRIAALEERIDNITTATDERIIGLAEEVAERHISEHNNDYDHDEYDRFDDRVEEKVSDAVTDAIDEIDFEDKVREIMRHASVSIDI